jgi:LPXTG-site transpeptidase (sortase) family protein
MILTGHRFKYLPPSNLTFYLFHKLEEGDIASVIWDNKLYYYRIKEIKTVSGEDTSILKQTKTPILTIYTCDPIYSTKNRLVVISELID